MDEKELKVLKYVKERIKGNEKAIYDTDANDDLINHEIGYYLEELCEKRYIIIKSKSWAVRGGQSRNKYKNNIIMIIYDHLKISQEGENAIKEAEKTKIEKITESLKEEGKSFGKEVYKESKKALAKYIAYILGFILFILIGGKILKAIEQYF